LAPGSSTATVHRTCRRIQPLTYRSGRDSARIGASQPTPSISGTPAIC